MSLTRILCHAACGAGLVLLTSVSASAQYVHLTLQSQPGDFIGQGRNYDILYTPTPGDYFFLGASNNSSVFPNAPDTVGFTVSQFENDPDNLLSLNFSTRELGTALVPGTYTDAQRFPFEAPGHPGLDCEFDHRGSNELSGSFTITNLTYTITPSNTFVLDAFDASFEQHSEGADPALFGQVSYRNTGNAPVPEVSTTVSFGLLLALGLGGVVIARKKKAAVTA